MSDQTPRTRDDSSLSLARRPGNQPPSPVRVAKFDAIRVQRSLDVRFVRSSNNGATFDGTFARITESLKIRRSCARLSGIFKITVASRNRQASSRSRLPPRPRDSLLPTIRDAHDGTAWRKNFSQRRKEEVNNRSSFRPRMLAHVVQHTM